MSKCWAQSHSSCGQGASGEHLISAGLFKQPSIFVQGFKWCPEEKEVGLNSLTAKILCGKHNSLLSEVDQAGIATIEAVDDSIEVAHSTRHRLSGIMFERWLLKTAINLTYFGTETLGIGMNGATSSSPSPYFVEAVYGSRILGHKMGVYFLLPKGEYLFKHGQIEVRPIHRNGEIGLVYFNLRGLLVLLSLFPAHAPPALESLGPCSLPVNMKQATPEYRMSAITIPGRAGVNTVLEFSWQS